MPAGPDQKFVMAYKIDSSKTPMHVDFEIKEGPVPSGKAVGIIKLDGDSMKLCYDSTGTNRPSKFETNEDDSNFMFVLKRAEKKSEKKFDAKKMVGKWECVKGVRAGAEVDAERMASDITFTKDSITIPAGAENFEMKYEIDASKSPVEINMEITGGPAPPDSRALGIVKMADGFFWICYDASPEPTRPKKFESTEENGYFMFKMEAVDD